MTDRKDRKGKPDRTRVSLSQRHERTYWFARFKRTHGASRREVCLAVECAWLSHGAPLTYAIANHLGWATRKAGRVRAA